jgi:hypothetical protein
MTSPIDGGGSRYIQPQVDGTDLDQVYSDGRVGELMATMGSDILESANRPAGSERSQANDPSSPDLPASDENAAAASEQQVKNMQNIMQQLATGNAKDIIKQLNIPPELKAALLRGGDSAEQAVQILSGQLSGKAQMEALAQLGLKTVPVMDGLSPSSFGFPSPGPVDPLAPLGRQQAQLAMNQMDSTAKAAQIVGAEAKNGTPGGDSLAAFLATISKAIQDLQQFLGSVQQADLKGNLGQSTEAGGDAGQVAEAKREEAEKKAKEQAGGGLFGGLSGLLGGIPIIGDLLGGAQGGGMFGDMFSGMGNIPIVGDLMDSLGGMLEGIPIIGDLFKGLGGEDGLGGMLGGIVSMALMVMLFPISLLLMGGMMGGGQAGAEMAEEGTGEVQEKKSKSKNAGGPDAAAKGAEASATASKEAVDKDKKVEKNESKSDGGGLLGGLFGGGGGDIPIIGDMLKGFTDLFSGIPIIGDLIGGDNPMGMLLMGVLCIACPVMIPVLLLLGVVGGGEGGNIPIIGDLLGGDGGLGGLFGAGGDKSSKDAKAAGNAVATSEAYGTATKQLLEDSGVSEDNAQLVAQIQKLISMLVSLKAAAQGGDISAIPTDQIMSIVEELSAKGIGGDSFKQAIALGQSGDAQGMINAISKGLPTNPADIASLMSKGSAGLVSNADLNVARYTDTIMSSIPA